jgi:hypothetical protein
LIVLTNIKKSEFSKDKEYNNFLKAVKICQEEFLNSLNFVVDCYVFIIFFNLINNKLHYVKLPAREITLTAFKNLKYPNILILFVFYYLIL